MHMHNTLDDAADTLRFARFDSDSDATDPDATSCYVLHDQDAIRRRRLIGTTRRDVSRLREALASGWDIGPELAYAEWRLAELEGAT